MHGPSHLDCPALTSLDPAQTYDVYVVLVLFNGALVRGSEACSLFGSEEVLQSALTHAVRSYAHPARMQCARMQCARMHPARMHPTRLHRAHIHTSHVWQVRPLATALAAHPMLAMWEV